MSHAVALTEEYVELVLWDKQAELAAQHLVKGPVLQSALRATAAFGATCGCSGSIGEQRGELVTLAF
jgi:hypothetical protein